MKNSTFNAAVARLLGLGLVIIALSGCRAEGGIDGDATDYFHQASGGPLISQEGFEIPREFAGLVASRQSTALAFEQAGEVAAIRVDEGEAVVAGQLLAVLDTRLLDAQRADLEARRQDLEAQVSLNAAKRDRADDLSDRGFAADQQIDELEAERRSLQARLAQVAAELDANTTRLDQSRLVAPFDGAISRRLVDEGAVVPAGAAVLNVLESSDMEARVGVPVRQLSALRPGQSVPVRVGHQQVEATVLAIGTDVTRATLTVPVRLALPERLDAVPGDQAYLILPEYVDEAGYWVPLTALTDGIRGLWNVYVATPTGENDPLHRLEARDVRVIWADDDRAFVKGALAPGETVILSGLQRVVPGQRVRLQLDPRG